VVLVTHDLAVARLLAHRLMVMRAAKWLNQGSPTRCWTIHSIPIHSFWCHQSYRPEMAGKRIIMETVIEVRGLSKGFTLHTQGGAHIPVFCNLDITVLQRQMHRTVRPFRVG
jgi:ABC-type dipeptide/oligopeptide/nickel transport system ATPase component